jgi:hypothetical protein
MGAALGLQPLREWQYLALKWSQLELVSQVEAASTHMSLTVPDQLEMARVAQIIAKAAQIFIADAREKRDLACFMDKSAREGVPCGCLILRRLFCD